MNVSVGSESLVVLAADRDIEETVKAVLRRPNSLGIESVQFESHCHPNRDGGCRANSAEFLRPFQRRFSHALVVFDREGCGSAAARNEIECKVEAELARSGWQARGKAVVIDPELEGWLWSDSPAVLEGLHWNGGYGALRSWLVKKGDWDRSSAKPHKPKAALTHTLKRTHRRRSARLYGEIAARVSLTRCQDPAFCKLKEILRAWFPLVADH